ncbi:hypothetical protein FQB35_04700 [Crassaminicella thermophila]|uniref:TrbC/VIRB2 family protein n=1 Tax=Crassaminicella thermophila TaxID=2599308 RepID=A0A5C0SEP4_CRATE|nr:hypothetical protein [Crassaminicella thermophila]QEK11718.1 hypothetical protein FQB35_04700 [Crassaminicella thermophila]
MINNIFVYGVIGKGIKGLSNKLDPIFVDIVNEISSLSWKALVTVLVIAGILWLFGNEFGAKKVARNGIYGFLLIQVAAMLL